MSRTVAMGLGGHGLAGLGPAVHVIRANEQLRALRGDGQRAEAHHRKGGDREGCLGSCGGGGRQMEGQEAGTWQSARE